MHYTRWVDMRRLWSVGWVVLMMTAGCVPGSYWDDTATLGTLQPVANPVVIPPSAPEAVWENVVDVIDDYFTIASEEPVRQIEGVVTGGCLYTHPEVGSTLLEPWRHDSASRYERVESTLQSIRRQAVVRVQPTRRGYEVEVLVYKELEDLAQPVMASAGAATLRYEESLNRVTNPVEDVPVHTGWIPMGRDAALEQRILGQLLARTGTSICR